MQIRQCAQCCLEVLTQAARASGLVLFERVRGRLIPTPEAHQLYAEVNELWHRVERVRDTSRELAQPTQATLRLVCSASLAPYLVSRTVAQLYQRFPRLQCRVQVFSPDILNQALLDHSTHLWIALLPHDHPNLSTVNGYQCGLTCVMRSDHPLAARKLIKPSDLAGERVISSPGIHTFRPDAAARVWRCCSQNEPRFRGNQLHNRLRVRAGRVGIAVVDQVSIAGGLLAGLEVRPFQSSEKLAVRIIRNRYRPMSVAERAFVEIFDNVWDSMSKSASAAPAH